MSEKATTAFWVIAALATIWNILGVAAYVAHVTITPEQIAQQPVDLQPLYAKAPAWATAAFAIAVFGGLLGSILLLLRKKLAAPVFLISLLAILTNDVYSFGIAKVQNIMGTQAFVMPGLVLLVAVFLIYFSRTQSRRGLLS